MKQQIIYTPLLSLLFLFSGCIESKEDKFEEEWHDKTNIKIGRSLTKNKNRDCGEFKYKKNLNYSSEYLVRCTRDGKVWKAYIVYSLIEEVEGPFKINPKND
ncbi:hypothetical protein [Sulfurimonas sp.]